MSISTYDDWRKTFVEEDAALMDKGRARDLMEYAYNAARDAGAEYQKHVVAHFDSQPEAMLSGKQVAAEIRRLFIIRAALLSEEK